MIVRFYYHLLRRVDAELMKFIEAFEALQQQGLFQNTYLFRTSDHGDLLGRDNRFQKWHTLEQRVTHVPMMVVHPSFKQLPKERKHIDAYTSHADVLPTMLGLAHIKETDLASELNSNFTHVRKLVGRDLSPLLRGEPCAQLDRPVYMRNDDQISQGLDRRAKLSGFVTFTPVRKTIGESFFPVIEGLTHAEAMRCYDDGKKWFLLRHYHPLNEKEEAFYLYNGTDDPLEIHDVKNEHSSQFDKLKTELTKLRAQHMDPPPLVGKMRSNL